MRERAGAVFVVVAWALSALAAEQQGDCREPATPPIELRLLGTLQDPGDRHSAREIVALAESTDGQLLAWADEGDSISVCSFKQEKVSTIVRGSTERYHSPTIRGMGFGEEGDLWWWYDQGNGGEAVKRAQMAADGSVKIGLAYSTTAIGVPTAVNLVPWGIVSMEGQRKSAFQPFGPWFLRAHVLGTNQVYASEPLIPDGSGRANEIVMNVVRSPDGRYLVALADEEATLLGLPSMKIIKRFDTHYNRSAAFSCSSALVAIATGSDGIFVWQTATGNPVRRISLYGTSLSLGFASGQSSMVFVGENALYPGSSPICRVDVNTGRVTALSDLHASVLLVSRSGERLYAGTQEGGVYVLELPVPDRPRSGDSGSAGS